MAKTVQKKAVKPIFLFNEIKYLVTPEALKHEDHIQMILDEESEKGLGIRIAFPEKIPFGNQINFNPDKPMSADLLFNKFIKDGKEPLGLSYLLGILKEQRYIKSFFYEIRFLEILGMKLLFGESKKGYSLCLRKEQENIVLDISQYIASNEKGETQINASDRISPSNVRFLVSFIEDEEEHPLKNKTIG